MLEEPQTVLCMTPRSASGGSTRSGRAGIGMWSGDGGIPGSGGCDERK